jgi:hypothetical protein
MGSAITPTDEHGKPRLPTTPSGPEGCLHQPSGLGLAKARAPAGRASPLTRFADGQPLPVTAPIGMTTIGPAESGSSPAGPSQRARRPCRPGQPGRCPRTAGSRGPGAGPPHDPPGTYDNGVCPPHETGGPGTTLGSFPEYFRWFESGFRPSRPFEGRFLSVVALVLWVTDRKTCGSGARPSEGPAPHIVGISTDSDHERFKCTGIGVSTRAKHP